MNYSNGRKQPFRPIGPSENINYDRSSYYEDKIDFLLREVAKLSNKPPVINSENFPRLMNNVQTTHKISTQCPINSNYINSHIIDNREASRVGVGRVIPPLLPGLSKPRDSEVTLLSFQYLQIAHHINNWNILPKSLSAKLAEFSSAIKPLRNNVKLTKLLDIETEMFKYYIAGQMKSHLMEELQAVAKKLGEIFPNSNPNIDIDKAIKNLKERLGKRFVLESSTRAANEIRRILCHQQYTDKPVIAELPLPRREIVKVNSTVIADTNSKLKRTITISTSNSFEALSDKQFDSQDIESDDDDATEVREETHTGGLKRGRSAESSGGRRVDMPDRKQKYIPQNTHSFDYYTTIPEVVNNKDMNPGKLDENRNIVSRRLNNDSEIITTSQKYLSGGLFTLVKRDQDINSLISKDTVNLIIGSSNLRKITRSLIPQNTQVLCIPGLRFPLVSDILSNLPPTQKFQHIVVAAGMCHVDDETPPCIKRLFNSLPPQTTEEFGFMGVSIDTSKLNNEQQSMLECINVQGREVFQGYFIEPILNPVTVDNGIHYTFTDAARIFSKIVAFLEIM